MNDEKTMTKAEQPQARFVIRHSPFGILSSFAIILLASATVALGDSSSIASKTPGSQPDTLSSDADYQAGAASFADGHYQLAIDRLTPLLTRFPGHVRLQMLLADACERAGQLAAARDFYRSAVANSPDGTMGAIATEGLDRLTRQIDSAAAAAAAGRNSVASASQPADGSDLSADQIAAMSVVGAEPITRRTEHFDITAYNPVLADLLARRVEAVLERARRTALREQLFPHRIELIVYPNQAAFAKAQPVADWSGGGFIYVPQADGSARRIVALYQVDEENRFRTALLSRELPHELTHVVLKEYFGQAACPQWLDEGLACSAEYDGGQATADRMADLLARQQAVPLAEMLDKYKGLTDRPVAFYAQAASWTRFLRSNLTDGQMKDFLAQIKDGVKPSVALGRALVVEDRPGWLGAMEERWHKTVPGKPGP